MWRVSTGVRLGNLRDAGPSRSSGARHRQPPAQAELRGTDIPQSIAAQMVTWVRSPTPASPDQQITAGGCRPSTARSCAWSPSSRICTSASARCSLRHGTSAPDRRGAARARGRAAARGAVVSLAARPAPLGLSEPRWIDDARLRPRGPHRRSSPHPDDPVSYASFEALRSTVLSAPLDRSRPLWQISLVPQLEDGRVGMVGKIHHALVDGLAALQIVSLILDPEPDVASQPPVAWRHVDARDPSAGRWTQSADVRRRRRRAARRGDRGHAPAGDRASVAAWRQARPERGRRGRSVAGAAESRSTCRSARGARSSATTRRATKLRAARRGGGTLNDVGLAAVAGAVRALAQRDGERPTEPLKTMVPVSMRRLGDAAAGNQIAMITIPLPVHLDAAIERLELVREQTRASSKPTGRRHAMLYQAAGLAAAAVALAGGGAGNTAAVQPHRLAVARAAAARCTSSDASSKRSTPSSRSPRATRSRSGWSATARSSSSAATPTRTRCRRSISSPR